MQRLTFEELCNQYNNWWNNMDGTIHYLQTQILTYEAEYFSDILLKTPTTSKYLLAFDDAGEQCNLFYDFDLSLDANKYTYYVDELENCAGLHNSATNTITIAPAYIEDKKIILHEMVHAYENILDTCGVPFIKELLFLELYKYLQVENIDVDERILAHSNMLSGIDIAEQGGNHSVFFLLKTLELDIKCHYKLGSICGYDRDTF